MGHCDNCGRDNKPTARFCAGCGSPLARSCATCGHELDADARFCEDCGSPVTASSPLSEPDQIAPSEAVRKTVTVLFCDLVGSTAFAERVDAESARESMSRYHAMAKSAIEANGGTVAKFIGDGVMALFGVPEVAEDDAERAVVAGADLQRGFEPVRDHIGSRYGIDLGLRVGINTGEVVIDDADADLVGDVLNTAARLEAECTPGQVLVGEETWRLTRSTIAYESLGEVSVKGKRGGLATYQLVLSGDGGAETGGARPDSTPFIGRDDELGRLRSLFDEAMATQEARLVTVIGSPGVGKTRLARELGAATADEADVVEIRCERAGTATFAPIVDLLQQVAGLDDGDTQEQIVAALRDLVGGERDVDRVVELLGGFVGTASPRSTEDAFFGVRRLVEVLGGHRPLVLVIDDIQWAEPLFLDLLEHLAEWSKTAPVMIVGLARPELRDIRPSLAETGRRVTLVVSLEGLDAAATELLAAELLGGAALPKELTAKLPSSTDGNPLFVRELIRMLVDDGVIAQRDDRWELAVDLDAVEVPPTIQSLLATRVERLPAMERRVLEQASVIGPEFPLGALAELMPEVGRRELEQVIERLRRKEQLDQTGTYWGDEPVVRFHHVLIRDAAYRRLLKGARAELHLRVGEWMDRTAAGLVGEFEVAIAYHFEQAQAYRHQLGDDDAATVDTGRRAAALLHVAAARALERDDLSAAGGLGRRAISCLADDDAMLPDLLVLACEAVLASGDATTGTDLVKRLSDRALGDSRLEAWATCFSAQLAVMTDPDGVQRATEQTQDAATQFEALGDQAGLAKARIVRAGALARLGQVGAAETQLDLALTAARAGNDRRRITSVLGAAPVAALWGPSPVARAGGRCLDVVRLSRIAADSPAVVATSSRCQAVLEAMRGRFDTARSLLSASRVTSLELGLDHGLLETSLFAGIVELLADDPVAAEPHLRDAFGGLGQLGIGADAGQAAAHLARSLMRQGRLDEAGELAADSDALAGQNLQTAIAARSVQAEILAARGDTGPALALADEAVRLAAGTDLVFDHANAMSALARVRAAAGDHDGAQRAASAARDLYTHKGSTVVVDVTAGPPATATPAATQPSTVAVTPADEEPWNDADRLFRQSMQSETSCSITTIATRGEDFVLSELHWTDPRDASEPRADTLHLSQWSGGEQVANATFDVDDLRAAVAELDRLFLETLDPIEGAPMARLSSSFVSLMNRDVDQMVAPSDPNIVLSDHRQLGWEHLSGVAELRERFRTLADLDGSVVSFIRNSLRQSPSYSCCRMRHVWDDPSGGRIVDDSIVLNRFDPASGLGVRVEQFSDDQLDEALACFDAVQEEIDATIPAPNTAVLAGGVANARARTASLDEFVAMFTDDFTATLTDGSTVTIDDLRTGAVEPAALGYGLVDRRIMSVLTDLLAMLYVGRDDGTGHWSVEEVDDTGCIHSVRQFASIADAADAIEQRWSELGVDDVSATVIRVNRAMRAMDPEAVGELLADEFWMKDHRPLGFPQLDREFVIASMAPGSGVASPDPLVVQCVYVVSPRAQVSLVANVTDSSSGYVWESLVGITVIGVGGGVLTSIEFFSEDNLDAAMARYHELTGTTPPADAPVAVDDEPWNDADRWMRQAIELRSAGLFAEWAQCFDEDVIWVSHRRITGGSYRGRDEVSAAYGTNDLAVSMSAEPLATRGDTFALHRHVWRYDERDIEFEFLLLTRWSNDGLMAEAAVHDLADLRAAVEQLDAWYAETLPPIQAAQLRTWAALFHALSAGDLDRGVRTLGPNAYLDSHRPIHWGHLDHGQLIAVVKGITEQDDAVFMCERVELNGPNVELGHLRLQVTDQHGSIVVSRWLSIRRTSPTTGLIEQIVDFDFDRIDDALESAEQLAAETNADPMVNTAVVVGGLVNALARYGEPGAFPCLLSDDFEVTLPDGSTVTRDGIVRGALSPSDLGFGGTRRKVVAVGGERVAMLAVTGDDDSVRWSIEVIDDGGRLREVRIFAIDEIAEAIAHYDERWCTAEGDALPRWIPLIQRFNRFLNSLDADGLREVLAHDYVVTDHRQMGFGTLDKAQLIEASELTAPTADDGSEGMLIRHVHAASERALVVGQVIIAVSPSGEMWERTVNVATLGVRDGMVTHDDLYEEDDLDAAMGRFHDLDGGDAPDDAASTTSRDAWNEADRLHTEMNTRWVRGDRSWSALLADHVDYDDRRPGLAHHYIGKQAVVDGWDVAATAFASVFGPQSQGYDLTTVAVRGGDLVVQLSRFGNDDKILVEQLEVGQWGPDGLLQRAVIFAPDDLAAAVDELNRLHMESVDPIEAGAWELGHIHYDAINDGDPAAALSVYDPSAVFVDHRLLGWGSIDIDGMRERFSTITNMTHDHLTYLRRMYALTPGVACATGRNHYITAEGIEIDDDILSVFVTDPTTGLVLGTEQFEPDDLDAALARFEELAAAAHARPIPTTRAVSIGGYANVRACLPEPDRFVDGLASDFTTALPDGTIVMLADLRAGTVAPATIGFGITERELIAVRGERLALLRIEGARWAIEEVDEHDRLVRVTLFANDDLLAARNAFEDVARAMPDAAAVPDGIWTWLDAHANYDLETVEALTHPELRVVDHRQLGYAPMDKTAAMALLRTGLDDESLRAIPIYNVVAATRERTAIIRGLLWLRAGSGGHWWSNPFIGVYGCFDDKLVVAELFPEDDLNGAMARFEELSVRGPTSAGRWMREWIELVNERRVDDLADRVAVGFTNDSRRRMFSFVLDRDQFIDGLRIFVEQGLTMNCQAVLATAGDLSGLQRCEVTGDSTTTTFLQIGRYDSDGYLVRLIDFDDDRLDEALAELARVSGEPVTLIDSTPS
ncbi:MAG TPA: AAA family ATPase [Ilumatobacteraceae bacterium]|nr:AAA family ATPase [Ilumatobacteraceae bacterium]